MCARCTVFRLIHPSTLSWWSGATPQTSREYLQVQGICEGNDRIFRATSAAVPNSIAALLIYLNQATGCIPHAYFHWTDVNPVVNAMRYIFLGEGDTAPLTHEVLRRAIKDPAQRPVVHVG